MQIKNFSIKTIIAGLSFMLVCATLSAKEKKSETKEQEQTPKVTTIEKKIGLPLPNDSTIL